MTDTTDTKRIQELADWLRLRGSTKDTWAAEALDELRQIKEAALSPAIEEIEKRQATARPILDVAEMLERLRDRNLCSINDIWLVAAFAACVDKDRSTLLTAYRAKSLEITRANADYRRVAGELDAAREKLALVSANFEALSKRATEERDRLKGELAAKEAECTEHAAEIASYERICAASEKSMTILDDELHAIRTKFGQCAVSEETLREQLAEAQKEIESLRARCAGCGAAIDPDTCGCGDSRSAGHDGHFFVPMGCDCYRAEPSTLQLLRRERTQLTAKDGEIEMLKAKLEAADSRDNRWIRERNEARHLLGEKEEALRLANKEIERILKERAAHRDTKTEQP